MTVSISQRTLMLVAIALAVAALMAARAAPTEALPQYAGATGQPCGTCHVNPAGGGTLTAQGMAFAAISTHATNPAAAFAQVTAPQPAPAPAQPQGPQVAVSISGAATDDSVIYKIMVRNTGSQAIGNVYVAGSVPAGANFGAATSTPAGGSFLGADSGSAAWLVTSIAANGSAGPFGYRVSKGSVQDLSVVGFAHWMNPTEGTAGSPAETPISVSEKLAVDQAINDKLNTSDTSLSLWYLQAGTGPRMDDLLRHFNIMWFAAQAGNWGVADFEAGDQVSGTVGRINVRNARLAPAMNFWMADSIKPLLAAIEAKDVGQFNAAYDHATAGCNSCHAAQPEGDHTLAIFKVVRPTTPAFSNLDYAGAK